MLHFLLTFCCPETLLIFKQFFFAHLYPFISFNLFLYTVPIALHCFALHCYLNTSLFVTHTFTLTKEGLHSENLITCKTVSIETPTQHSMYDVYT